MEMKKIWVALGGAVVVGAIGFFGAAPILIDDVMNPVRDHEPYDISAEARDLHASLFVADAHADPLLWNRNLLKHNARGMSDVPRLLDGNVAIQVFGSVTKTPKNQNYASNPSDTDNITLLAVAGLWPMKSWSSLLERALYHSEKLHEFADGSAGRLSVVGTVAELNAIMTKRQNGENVMAAFLGLEGAHALEGDIGNVDRLYDAGYRMIGLAHFFDNEVAGSMHGEEKYGLTDLGRKVVRRAEELGMIVDIAHSSLQTLEDVIAYAERPLIYSHGGVQGTCEANRNLSDAHIKRIAEQGGLIALGAWDAATCGDTPAHLAKAMRYVRDLVGIEYVAVGSDFDGAIRTAFEADEYVALTQALLDEGFSHDEVRLAMGQNALNFYRRMLPQS